jgi:2-desacetyl-2-hydroxyethyl bacteriochlorophyllide A dehydrogenase
MVGSSYVHLTIASFVMPMIPLAQVHGVDDLRLDLAAAPVCGPDDVVVEVHECGICGSDLGYLAMGGLTAPGVPMPIGHELWGMVSEAGANVSHVVVGDRVVVQPMSNGNNIGNGGAQGGFSPYLLVRNAALDPRSTVKVPEQLPPGYGALVEPLSVAQHGANRVAATAHDKTVIFGAGPIGLSMVQVLLYRGLNNIIVVDLSDRRLEAARAMGVMGFRGDDAQLAQKIIDCHGTSSFFGMPMPGSTLFVEATGVRSVFEQIVAMAGPRSRICLTGVHKEAATIDLVMLLAKEVVIIPAMGYDDEFDEVIAMLQSGKIDPTVMVTHHFPLSDITAAFALAKDPTQAIKIMIDCQA